jgi:hypothetical protein
MSLKSPNFSQVVLASSLGNSVVYEILRYQGEVCRVLNQASYSVPLANFTELSTVCGNSLSSALRPFRKKVTVIKVVDRKKDLSYQ